MKCYQSRNDINHEMLSFLVKRDRMISFAVCSFWEASIPNHPQKSIGFWQDRGEDRLRA